MLGEFFAYCYGKSVGRERERRGKPKQHLTGRDLIQLRLYAFVILLCVVAVISATLLGHS